MVCICLKPDYDDCELVNDYVKDRQRGVNRELFNQFQEEWKRAVLAYCNQNGNPEFVVPLGVADSLSTSLRNLYLSPNKKAESVLAELRSHCLVFCPFCGEMGRPNTLDHYLPKDIFPEFSITSANLVPMCDKCQTLKGDKYLANDRKAFLHPYYDCDSITLYLRFDGAFESVDNIFLDIEVEESLQELCKNHSDFLSLKSRLTEHCSVVLPNIKMSLKETCGGKENPEQLIRLWLEMNVKANQAIAHNHWDAIIYRSLLRSDEWIAYVVREVEARGQKDADEDG
ncbi:MAG: hypothetical protein ACNI27_14115 [Desulfovibrio sp.]